MIGYVVKDEGGGSVDRIPSGDANFGRAEQVFLSRRGSSGSAGFLIFGSLGSKMRGYTTDTGHLPFTVLLSQSNDLPNDEVLGRKDAESQT